MNTLFHVLMRRIRRGSGVAVLAFLLALGPAVADEVHLTNGDRLTGEIVDMAGGFLTLKTPYAGDVRLSWEDVACLTSERELIFLLRNREVLKGRATCPAQGSVQILGRSVVESAELPLTELDAINPSPPPPAVTYKGNIAAGGSVTDGNTDDTVVYFSAGFEARSKQHRFTLGGRYNYGETDSEITTRNALGRVKYDFFLTDRVYSYAQGLFERDDFQDLNLRSAMGLGLGYQFLDTERTSLFAETGLSYFNEDFDTAKDDHHASARESAGFTFAIVPERIKFFHLHEFYYNLEESNDYYFRAEQGLRFLLFGRFFANFQVDYSYDREPAPGRKSADTLYITSLGYEFQF